MNLLEKVEYFGLLIALKDYEEKSKNEDFPIEEYFLKFKNTSKLGLKHSIDLHINPENRIENLIFFVNLLIRQRAELLNYYKEVNSTWIKESKKTWKKELYQLQQLKIELFEFVN